MKNNEKLKFHNIIILIFMVLSSGIFTSGTCLTYWTSTNKFNVFNIGCELCCLYVLALFYFGACRIGDNNRKSDVLITISILVFISINIDILVNMLEGKPRYRELVLILDTVFFVMINLDSLAFYYFVRLITHAKYNYGYIVSGVWFIICSLMMIANCFYGFFFEVDICGNIIVNTPYYMLSFAYPTIMSIASTVCGYKYHAKKEYIYVIYGFTSIPLILSMVFSVLLNTDMLLTGLTIATLFAYNVLFTDLQQQNSSLQNAFERFFSDDIIKKLVDEKNGTFSEPKYQMCTILTVDIRGFTSISQRLLPRKLVEMINHYFGVMNEIVEKNEGVVLEFLGDGFTAVFGAPIYVNNYTEKAVYAAIQMQNAVVSINEWNKEHGYPEIEIGVGINTGEMLLGSFGSNSKASFKAVGDEADFCSKIESLSTGGSVLISRSTLDEIHCEHDIRPIYSTEDSKDKKEKDIYLVYSLGEPYQVSVDIKEEKMIELVNKVPITFKAFVGKRIGNTEYHGYITALGDKEIKIESDDDLSSVYEIDLSNRNYNYLYAKRYDFEKKEGVFRFTSKPTDFPKWCRKILINNEKLPEAL